MTAKLLTGVGERADRVPELRVRDRGRLGALKVLLSRGANDEATSKRGFTPLLAATHKARPRVVEYLSVLSEEL